MRLYNYFMLIGYVANELEIQTTPTAKKVLVINIAVRRSFMNSDGNYTTDYVPVHLWTFLAEYAIERIKKGSKIGLIGRARPKYETTENGYRRSSIELDADKIIFFDALDDSKKTVSMELPNDLGDEE